jgi:hypothetical protein
MKAVRFAIILAIATVLIFVMYRLRPRTAAAPPPEPQDVAAANTTPSASPATPTNEAPAEAANNLPELLPLPLAHIAIEAENGMWRTNSDYQIIPHGTQSFGGIDFVFDGLLQLQSTSSEAFNRSYRTNITLALTEAGAQGGKFAALHLVCGTRWWTQPNSQLATLVWHYTDGKSRSVSIVYQNHVRDWVRPPYEEPPHLPYKFSKVIWHSANVTESGRWQRLYRTSLPNPEPKKPVTGVELVSSRAEATLIVLATTLDRLPPGARPDDSPDLEPTDIGPPQYLQVLVVDRRSLPIAGAQLRVQSYPTSTAAPASTRYLTSDPNGAITVAFPPSHQRRLELAVSHDDYGSRKMAWDIQAGNQVPSTYTFKLDQAVTIGGIVVNNNSDPVIDATLTFWRYWSGGDRPDAKGEQPDFSNRSVNTDAGGIWQLKGVPVELLGHIGFGLKHPDYPSTNMTFHGDDATEQQLRAGTFKIVLGAGMNVAGRVLDGAENPLANATVSSGQRYSNNRQNTTTDAAGKFSLKAVEQGDVIFTASADGYAAESKMLNVHSGMAEVVLHLKPGHSIRGIVQNENNQPVSGVRVVLEDTRFVGGNNGLEFSTTTGEDGRFEWKSAPDEAKAFYIGKQGYEQLRNKMLDIDIENIVTLHKPRRVEGYVLDAGTGQPVTEFKASVGQSFNQDQFYANGGQTKDYSDPNGHFTLDVDDQLHNAVRVEAKDYAAQIQELGTETRSIKLEFRLKPSAALKGIVLSPDGQPQPGVQVAITKGGGSPGNHVRLRNGRLESFGDKSRIVTTDANGLFTLDSPPETGGIVFAAGGSGYGSAPVEEVRASGRVVLQDYGQIEGTLKIGGAPAPGQELFFTMFNSGIDTDFNNFKVSTDADGSFKFTKLPAGEGEIVRLIRTTPNSWAHSHKTNVTVVAGQTTYISLGDSGALLKGTARLQFPWTEEEKLFMSGTLHNKRPNLPSFSSPAESQAFFKSAEWQSQMKAQQYFAVAVAPDGSFTIDSVPAGSYALEINASRPGNGPPIGGQAVASGTLEVTVPDNPNPLTPIQVGEVLLLSVTNNPQRFPRF